MKLFWCQDFFFENFEFINECKNEFEDDNEKSCSRFKKGLPLKSFLEPIGLKSPTRQFGSELQKIFEIP